MRRREALVKEARRIFARQGAGVALEAVAEAAGVGIATLYRNFASRQLLLDAVATAVLVDVTESTDNARSAFAAGEQDPWVVWTGWADHLAELELGALAAALAGEYGPTLSADVVERQRNLEASLTELFSVVQGHGFIGAAVTPLELVVGIGRVTRPHVSGAPVMDEDLGKRLVGVMLCGLRNPEPV